MTEIHRQHEGRRPLPLQWIEEDGFDLGLAIRPPSEPTELRSPPPRLVSETSFLPFSPPQP